MPTIAVQPGSPPLSAAQTGLPAPAEPVRRLLQLEVPVIVKLAERMMPLADVLQFSVGAIIELNRSANDPLDLLVNNVPIGQGEVVKVGENFGLRINRVGSAEGTIRALGTPGPDNPPV